MRIKIAAASLVSAVVAMSGMYGVQRIGHEMTMYHKLQQAVITCGTQADPKTGFVGTMTIGCVAEGAR